MESHVDYSQDYIDHSNSLEITVSTQISLKWTINVIRRLPLIQSTHNSSNSYSLNHHDTSNLPHGAIQIPLKVLKYWQYFLSSIPLFPDLSKSFCGPMAIISIVFLKVQEYKAS